LQVVYECAADRGERNNTFIPAAAQQSPLAATRVSDALQFLAAALSVLDTFSVPRGCEKEFKKRSLIGATERF